MQSFSKIIEITNAAAQGLVNGGSDYENRVYITQENANRTIYLADLPKSVTYLELSEFFEKEVGPCMIAIKRPLFKNFYYAFVQFQKREHATKVLTSMRFPEFAGASCRALPFNNKQASATSGTTPSSKNKRDLVNLFVKGLPKTWQHGDLCKLFEEFGTVSTAKVSIDAQFCSRGYGYVALESEAAANAAIEALNDKPLSELKGPSDPEAADSKLQVGEYIRKLDRDGTQNAKCSTNLYVKNFPPQNNDDDFTEDQLRDLFTKFGQVQSAKVMRDEDGKSKGFGFVCFEDWQCAQKALDQYSSDRMAADRPDSQSKELYVAEARSKEQRQFDLAKSTFQWKRSMHMLNLIVRNLDPETTKEEFDQFFSNFGEIRSSKVVPDSMLGFVCYKERESARKAKDTPNLVLRGRDISVSFCEPKESRQKQLEEKWDKKAYEKHRNAANKSSNQDVLTLITSLSLLMGQLQNGGNSNMQGGMARMANRPNQGSSRHFNPAAQQMNGMPHHPNQQQVIAPGSAPNNMRRQQHQNGYGQNMQQPMPQPLVHQQQQQQQQPAPAMGFNVPPILSPELMHHQQYRMEIMNLFQSESFQRSSEDHRKQMVGTSIFRQVTAMVGDELSPKITGMIIDLPIADLNFSVSTYETLQQKVRSAVQLLLDTRNVDEAVVKKMPMNAQQASKMM